MQSQLMWKAVALTVLLCGICLAEGDDSSDATAAATPLPLSLNGLASVGTVQHNGVSLRAFEVSNTQFAEPTLWFGRFCSVLWYNRLYHKYVLSVPFTIDTRTLNQTLCDTAQLAAVTVDRIEGKANRYLDTRKGSDSVGVLVHSVSSDRAELQLLCNTLVRCLQLRDELDSDAQPLLRSISFKAAGRVGETPIRFGTVKSENLPSVDCKRDRWIVFQRRVDGSLSFSQNWDTYAKGFGSPDSNYWMGLEQLSNTIVHQIPYCQLRIESEDFGGNSYWGEWHRFQVYEASDSYRLRLGKEVNGSQFQGFVKEHNYTQFSTFDRDNDNSTATSCSQRYTNGGWWFSDCYSTFLNGLLLPEKSDRPDVGHWAKISTLNGTWVHFKRTEMKFRCP